MARPLVRGEVPALLHPGFIAVGSALLIAAFVTDVMYSRTSLWQWANFSTWLIAGGLVMALVATIFLIIDFAIGRAGRLNWVPFILVALAALLSLANVFIHSRDAWTSVVPEGIWLSLLVTVLLIVAGLFRGWRVTTTRGLVVGDHP